PKHSVKLRSVVCRRCNVWNVQPEGSGFSEEEYFVTLRIQLFIDVIKGLPRRHIESMHRFPCLWIHERLHSRSDGLYMHDAKQQRPQRKNQGNEGARIWPYPVGTQYRTGRGKKEDEAERVVTEQSRTG